MFINVTTRQQISIYSIGLYWYLLACTPTFGKVGVQKLFFARSDRESCFVPHLKIRGAAHAKNTFPLWVIMLKLVVLHALKDVGINAGEPQIGERWNSAILRCEAWLTPRYTPSPACCHVNIGSFATKGVRINRRKQPKLGIAGVPPLVVWSWLTP